MSSTRAVKMRTPAEMASRTPGEKERRGKVSEDVEGAIEERREDRLTSSDRRVSRAHADGRPSSETDGHSDRSHDRVEDGSEEGDPVPRGRKLKESESRSKTESLEHLMEDDDDEKDVELKKEEKGANGGGSQRWRRAGTWVERDASRDGKSETKLTSSAPVRARVKPMIREWKITPNSSIATPIS